jgi:hypothetical protein
MGRFVIAKLTSKNQLTLPKSVTAAVGSAEYFDVETRNGQIVLTPVRIQRGDSVRAKLAELNLQEKDIADAIAWRGALLPPKYRARNEMAAARQGCDRH